jgi:DNA gyrase subunit A
MAIRRGDALYGSAVGCLAEELLKDLDKETVPFQDNYDGTAKTLVLRCSFPNLLIIATSGIAVGMATSIRS